jgi:hypothetical protein
MANNPNHITKHLLPFRQQMQSINTASQPRQFQRIKSSDAIIGNNYKLKLDSFYYQEYDTTTNSPNYLEKKVYSFNGDKIVRETDFYKQIIYLITQRIIGIIQTGKWIP